MIMDVTFSGTLTVVAQAGFAGDLTIMVAPD